MLDHVDSHQIQCFVADEDLHGQNILLSTPSSSIATKAAQYNPELGIAAVAWASNTPCHSAIVMRLFDWLCTHV